MKRVLFIGVFLLFSSIASSTHVNMNHNEIVAPDENFTVSIYVFPTEPIKGVEMKLSFNPSVLQVDAVTEGDLFDGVQSWFNEGIIDNINGTVINMYSFIMIQKNSSNSGIFANISFTAKNDSLTYFHLYDVGICNETQYLDIDVTSNSVIIIQGEYAPWDITEDGICNYLDVSSILAHYGETGQPGWLRDDINDDGIVNYIDISAVISHYGE